MGKNVAISSFLEVLVAILTLLPLLFSILCFILGLFAPQKYDGLVGTFDTPYIATLAILTCIILGAWIFLCNGSESKLWNWLPPYVFFRGFDNYSRVVLVVLLIMGTLIGLFGKIFNLVDPAFF